MSDNNSSVKKDPLGEQDSNRSDDRKKVKIALIIAVVIAIIAALVFTIKSQREAEDIESQSGKTAEVIEGTDTTQGSDTSTSVPSGVVRTAPNGMEYIDKSAPDHITGVPKDKEVQRGLYEHKPGDIIPADPNEAVRQTLTVPVTPRYNDHEAPDFRDPSQAPPKMLAREFLFDTFSGCVKTNGSYNKNLRKAVGKRATPEFRKRGLGDWATGREHTLAWDIYSDDTGCNSLTAYPVVRGFSVGSPNTIYYDVRVSQRITKGGKSTNITPFTGKVKMKFINDKWLVDDFQIDGAKIPVVH